MRYMLKTTIVAVLGLLLLYNNATAQQQEGTSVGDRLGHRVKEIMEMSKIGQAYQNSDLLSYDVAYDFADSAAPAINLEHKTGKYGLYDNLFWGTIDTTTEFVQGSQYYVVVDHESKNIMVYDKLEYSRAINVPLLDSLFNSEALLDLFLTRPGGVYKKLSIKYNPGMQYKQVDMLYDSTTYLLKSIAYYYNTTVYGQAYNNCADSVTTLVVPSSGVTMPGMITCSTLVKTYKNFIAEFPGHSKGATVRMYVAGGGVALNSTENSQDYAGASLAEKEIKELWVMPQSVSGIAKPLADSIKPPVPSKKMKAMSMSALSSGIWVDSAMSALQLFEWYMNEHLAVQYSGFVYADWLVNTCGYKLYQLPWNETATVNKDTLQNIWNSFANQYPASQLSITETVSVPVIKNVGSHSFNNTDYYEGDHFYITTWTSNSTWYKSRQATTYDLSVLPGNAIVQSANLSLYANKPSWLTAAHFRYVSQSPYLIIQPVKGLFIPGKTGIDLYPENYPGIPLASLPPLSTDQVSGGPGDFWSNQNYLNQNISSTVSAMYTNMQTTGVNYPVQYKLNDESFDYKSFYFGGTECSDISKRPVLNVSYTASRCDVFAAYVNKALGTWLSYEQVKELFKYAGKLDINGDCTAATPGEGCDGAPGSGKLITAVTTISFTKTDETTFDLNLFGESRFFYKIGEVFHLQERYTGYNITPVLTNR